VINKEEIVKVNCSFCKKEIECPVKMLNVDRHMCYDCYKAHSSSLSFNPELKTHIDIPLDKLKEFMSSKEDI
jgi:hypothetical protein